MKLATKKIISISILFCFSLYIPLLGWSHTNKFNSLSLNGSVWQSIKVNRANGFFMSINKINIKFNYSNNFNAQIFLPLWMHESFTGNYKINDKHLYIFCKNIELIFRLKDEKNGLLKVYNDRISLILKQTKQ
ncbi:MAG TPA: hypothetical protein QF753_20730 [Victivallales bacterium]|nr:hypothetical protein [Victivallales bacterium]